MKIEKNKHDHKLTHLLKVCIFAMLMIAPLFASCSQLMYVTFNKNAYQSTQITGTEYYTTYEYETNEVNSVDDLIVGNIYKITLENAPTQQQYISYFTAVYNLNDVNFIADISKETSYIVIDVRNEYIALRNYDYSTIMALINEDISYPFSFYGVLYQYHSSANYDYTTFSASDYLGETIVNERPVQALDNAFYYGVEKMTESPLFNWTQNTALYTGIKAMTDNLQVQTNVIAVLVTYWTILTIIYIIIDIVLALFTKMTHLLVRSD